MTAISVTIFADASFCSATKAAGWGCWIKSGPAPGVITGAPMEEPARSSGYAELFALAKALDFAAKSGTLSLGCGVSLQSDCAGALSIILHAIGDSVPTRVKGGLKLNTAKRVDPATLKSPAMKLIREVVRVWQLKLFLRHVPGHKNGEGRAWVNRVCDERARQGMQEHRRRLVRAAEHEAETQGACQ